MKFRPRSLDQLDLDCFIVGGPVGGAPGFDEDELNEYVTLEASDLHLSDLVIDYGKTLRIAYEYDYGDNWRHVIEIEELMATDSSRDRLPTCITGAHHRPPEDVGGPHGYLGFL